VTLQTELLVVGVARALSSITVVGLQLVVVLVGEPVDRDAVFGTLVVVGIAVGIELGDTDGDLELLGYDEVAGLENDSGVIEVGEALVAVVRTIEDLAVEREPDATTSTPMISFVLAQRRTGGGDLANGGFIVAPIANRSCRWTQSPEYSRRRKAARRAH
jgi:hypothetical protein